MASAQPSRRLSEACVCDWARRSFTGSTWRRPWVLRGQCRWRFILPDGPETAAINKAKSAGNALTDINAEGPGTLPEVSVVIPVCNEEENVLALAREIHAALSGRYAFETIFVDDGSTDGTLAAHAVRPYAHGPFAVPFQGGPVRVLAIRGEGFTAARLIAP